MCRRRDGGLSRLDPAPVAQMSTTANRRRRHAADSSRCPINTHRRPRQLKPDRSRFQTCRLELQQNDGRQQGGLRSPHLPELRRTRAYTEARADQVPDRGHGAQLHRRRAGQGGGAAGAPPPGSETHIRGGATGVKIHSFRTRQGSQDVYVSN